MLYKRLGKTNLRVSLLGFGGIPLQRIKSEVASQLIDRAIDLGVNFFDTARGYTDSEVKIGGAIKDKRDKVIIASKSMDRTKEGILRDIDISLKNLQTDYIDLYQLHNIKTDQEISRIHSEDGALKGLEQAQREGKIRYIGITSHIARKAVKAIKEYDYSTIQFPRNYIEAQGEEELFPLARQKDMGIIVMKPLGGGAMGNPELALKYLFNAKVNTVIPGMDSIEQLEENFKAMKNYKDFTVEDRMVLENEKKIIGENFCRRCDYCKPCPKGIDISGLFVMHGYYKRYDLQDWAKDRYGKLEVKGDSCIECGVCESRCPYNLPIRKMIKEVHRDLK